MRVRSVSGTKNIIQISAMKIAQTTWKVESFVVQKKMSLVRRIVWIYLSV